MWENKRVRDRDQKIGTQSEKEVLWFHGPSVCLGVVYSMWERGATGGGDFVQLFRQLSGISFMIPNRPPARGVRRDSLRILPYPDPLLF